MEVKSIESSEYNGGALDCAAILRAAEPPLGLVASWKRFCLLCWSTENRYHECEVEPVREQSQVKSERNKDREKERTERERKSTRGLREQIERRYQPITVMEILSKKKGIIIL